MNKVILILKKKEKPGAISDVDVHLDKLFIFYISHSVSTNNNITVMRKVVDGPQLCSA